MAPTSGPNSSVDVLEGEPGVLHGVVQQGRGHRSGVEAQLGHDGGHRHGVGDVGLAGLAELALVRLLGDLAGPDDQLPVGGAGPGPAGVVGGQDAPQQVVEHRRPAERGSQTLDGDHLLTVPGRTDPQGTQRRRRPRPVRRLAALAALLRTLALAGPGRAGGAAPTPERGRGAARPRGPAGRTRSWPPGAGRRLVARPRRVLVVVRPSRRRPGGVAAPGRRTPDCAPGGRGRARHCSTRRRARPATTACDQHGGLARREQARAVGPVLELAADVDVARLALFDRRPAPARR